MPSSTIPAGALSVEQQISPSPSSPSMAKAGFRPTLRLSTKPFSRTDLRPHRHPHHHHHTHSHSHHQHELTDATKIPERSPSPAASPLSPRPSPSNGFQAFFSNLLSPNSANTQGKRRSFHFRPRSGSAAPAPMRPLSPVSPTPAHASHRVSCPPPAAHPSVILADRVLDTVSSARPSAGDLATHPSSTPATPSVASEPEPRLSMSSSVSAASGSLFTCDDVAANTTPAAPAGVLVTVVEHDDTAADDVVVLPMPKGSPTPVPDDDARLAVPPTPEPRPSPPSSPTFFGLRRSPRSRSPSPVPGGGVPMKRTHSGSLGWTGFIEAAHALLEEKLRALYSALLPTFDGLLDGDGGAGGAEDGFGDVFAGLSLDEASMNAASTSDLFLERYSRETLAEVFLPMAEGLEKAGFDNLIFQLDISDPFVHRISLTDLRLLPSKYTTKSLPDAPRTVAATSAYRLEISPPTATGGNRTVALLPCPHFEVTDSNFLIDIFARRKRVDAHDLKGYQDLVRSSLGEPSDAAGAAAASPAPSALDDATQPRQHRFRLPLSDARRVKRFLETTFPAHCSVTVLEWTCMQNPLVRFVEPPPGPTGAATPEPAATASGPAIRASPAHRFAFPGQRYPGLGVAREFQRCMTKLVRTPLPPGAQGSADTPPREGLMSVPDHWHLAWMYQATGHKFVNPAFAGYFDALAEDLAGDLQEHGIAAVSWAFHNGHVVDAEGTVEVWQPQDLVYPTAARTETYFGTEAYGEIRREFFARYRGRVRVDWENAREIWRFSSEREGLVKRFGGVEV
ncbi:hypothetical protein HDU96_011126 [Phlyctochytrium bullatum]|nr:hypothetical protein HDU96_011126 [Phlyctochytrium bullatum]